MEPVSCNMLWKCDASISNKTTNKNRSVKTFFLVYQTLFKRSFKLLITRRFPTMFSSRNMPRIDPFFLSTTFYAQQLNLSLIAVNSKGLLE